MPSFKIVSDFALTGDQPQAVEKLAKGLVSGLTDQTLLGVTGSGKTFTMANVIARVNRPTLIISHNKTLAAQLYSEMKEFLPENSVEYFVSYYDYYQPEAYVPQKDMYIEKDSDINEEIDKLRHAATRALFERRDVVIVASVSCIYGLGEPEEYRSFVLPLKKGQSFRRDLILRRLVDMQYERNDLDFSRGKFRLRGDTLEIQPAYEELALRVEFFGDEIERIVSLDPVSGELLAGIEEINIYPAKHFVTSAEKMAEAIKSIQAELEDRLKELEAEGKMLEAARLKQRTNYDLEMMEQAGYCSGVENYSRHLAGRKAGSAPWTLLDYFPEDFLLIVDESHMSLPQIRGMYAGDSARKKTLVDYGFRLPSAMDNRPLSFDEFKARVKQAIYVSATPGPYEKEHSLQVVEQLVRPTGLLEPVMTVKPTVGQIDDLLEEVKKRVAKNERVLITTLTKKMSEKLADYLVEMGVKTHYLHSEVDTLERIEILRDLRLGVYDVIVGINLLREGLDLPEVSLVAILDADKEGYLRSEQALIQTMGRAARHVDGQVIMYADKITGSMQRAMDEIIRRRKIQEDYNRLHNITPQGIRKAIKDINERIRSVTAEVSGPEFRPTPTLREDIARLIKELESQMKKAAKNLEFERAALIRDRVVELRAALEIDPLGRK
ncbi:excinuclease ABC subunit UvrB [Dehalococcoides mccartyi]|jgi:excinuclease ABC subunit B|uniref:UvrABC system protein B n=2 Tax=Dehalococcoides mccartyi TaxID=61435 RepID=UVRB_DEHMC|nr:excinuclease ABC subunit UvrB [Dehalococcoides mccartyi]Q3ZZK7.1 RecName: Full=UvrABC system protein B; Short=Protein UvrB; AltName: Full=Excinuclease ABC subunit B [Dehalococcoides mccartyi CBDB1]AII60544.1 excinuclease ABC subunit B [Dehalococcoides mccartyi CG5]AMU86208.1 excinuclease ABC subunit B [Dehalococcoides mccartyi]AOV99047.1 excinuclease ABC subunit B [Dehalococcoides mccartyi]MBA2084819.1 Excinuclease ABC subunit B [Dehalococcoides mccartyi]QBX63556.1 excinuclease ABC subunit